MRIQTGPVAAGLLVTAFTNAGWAQTPAEEAAPPLLEEIVISAERREQNLLSLPITASVMSADDLARDHVSTIDQLQNSTPALSINDTGLGKFINIRGIGKSLDLPNIAPGVAYYIDGLLLPNQIFLDNPYFDLQRVEILRGPQGTLVGTNSTGGAILTVSQKPKLGVTEGSIEQSFGNYSELRTRAMINLPVGDEWAVRLAGEWEKHDSYFTNISPTTTGNTPGNLNRYALRFGLDGNITTNLELSIRAEINKNNTDGPAAKPTPGVAATAAWAAAAPTDPYTINYDIRERRNMEAQRLSAELNWQVTDGLKLRSITGYQYGTIDFLSDPDASPINTGSTAIKIHEPVFTQEVNLLSTGPSALQWVVGAFYMHQDTNGAIDAINANFPFSPLTPLDVQVTGRGRTRNEGLFGQATYSLTDALKLTVGLRGSKETHFNDTDGQTVVANPYTGTATIPAAQLRAKSSALTGKVALDYQLTHDQLLYILAARGYKGGGVNDNNTSFNPEFVWNYEGGLKSTWLDGKLRSQVDAYYAKYSGLQLQVYDPILALTAISNASSAKVYGVEFQSQAQLQSFGFQLSAAYTHSALGATSLIDTRILPGGGNVPLGAPCTAPGVPAGCFNYAPFTVTLNNQALPFAPKLTYSIGVDYGFFFDHFSLTPHVQVSHVDEQWATVFEQQPTDFIAQHTLVDGAIQIRSGKHWSGELYGSNLGNRTYVSSKSGYVEYFGAPRQYGARVGYQF